MTSPEPYDADDPFAAHFHREPMGAAGIDLLVLGDASSGDHDPTEWEASLDWLRAEGRTVVVVTATVDGAEPRLNNVIEDFLGGASRPIIAICRAARPPAAEHWRPLLTSLDQADHVVGGRPTPPLAAAWRGVSRFVRRLVLGVPVADVHSPLQLHRAEKLREIPLQSGSSFVDVEILAKATFLGHVLDEPAIPSLPGFTWKRGRWSDLGAVFKHPTFRRPAVYDSGSGPLEESQGQPERADGPGGEDREGTGHLELSEPGPFQDHQA